MAIRSVMCVMALALCAAPLRAQQDSPAPQVKLSGFWAGGGLGAASTGINCELCAGDSSEGFSGFLTAGFTLSPRLRLGAEANAWFDGTDGVNQRLALFGASLYWAPNPERPWHLKGGLGLVRYHAGTDDPDDDGLTPGRSASSSAAGTTCASHGGFGSRRSRA